MMTITEIFERQVVGLRDALAEVIAMPIYVDAKDDERKKGMTKEQKRTKMLSMATDAVLEYCFAYKGAVIREAFRRLHGHRLQEAEIGIECDGVTYDVDLEQPTP